MPFIMEDQSYGMDVDDLFGDSEHVTLPALPTIPTPTVKGLARRLDELSASGCCQKITWSKSGCVAYITPDGFSVKLKVFARDPATGKWDLGKDAIVELPRQDEVQYVHLSWSHLGNDIAVVDAAGHVSTLTCTMALDRMTVMRADVVQPETEMDAVVGMHWLAFLPYEHKNNIVWSANRQGEQWDFQMASHRFNDAHHPMESKAAIIYLRRQGELRLRFQQPDSSWHEAATTLEPMISTRESFSHAAFASNNDNTLLLAAYDISGRLHLYRIEPKWNYTPPQPGPQQGQPPKFLEKPELHVSKILVEESCYPVTTTVGGAELGGGSETKDRIPAQLTHLNFLPTTPEHDDGTLPTIQAIFSAPPNSVSLDQPQAQQNPLSIVVKWEIQQTQQNQLHPSLDKVTSKRKTVNSVPARDVFLMKRLTDVMMHSVVLNFIPLWYNMLLAYCYGDGSIIFQRRANLQPLAPDYNAETVTSLIQAGFTFPAHEPSLYQSLSANHCIAACMQQDGTIKLRSIEYNYGSLASDEEDPKHSAALAALVLQFASAANQYFSSDDILSIIGELSDQRKRDFISLLFHALNVNLDCGIDDSSNNHLMLLGRSPFFVKTLSAAHLLGLDGNVQRSMTSKIAWMVLNIKYITQILTTIARMHGQIDKNALRPEIVPQFIGICRWIIHFMVYMMDEIIAVGFKIQKMNKADLNRQALEAMIEELNKPAILVLLSSFPRMMMKLWANPLAWVARSSLTYTNHPHSLDYRRLYAPLNQAVSEFPEWRFFESLLSESQKLVRKAYRDANLSEQGRNEAERQLMLGRLPDVLVPAARGLLTDTLFNENHAGGALLDKLDVAKVMFFDTTWLGLQESNQSKAWFDSHIVDICQKVVVRGQGSQTHPVSVSNQARNRSDSVGTSGGTGIDKKKTHLRRCVRCGSFMEDVTQGMPGYSPHHISWLIGVAKHCVCGNAWMLVPDKKDGK